MKKKGARKYQPDYFRLPFIVECKVLIVCCFYFKKSSRKNLFMIFPSMSIYARYFPADLVCAGITTICRTGFGAGKG